MFNIFANANTPANAKHQPGTPLSKGPRMTVRDRIRQASRPPSFTDQLPWSEFDSATGTFVLADGRSHGLLFELTATATEARSVDFLANRRHQIQSALSAIPQADDAEWIVQHFVNDDDNIAANCRAELERYVQEANSKNPERAKEILQSQYTQTYMKEIEEHLAAVSTSAPEGFFMDDQVSGHPWRGTLRRVRCALYRPIPANFNDRHEMFNPIEQLKQVGEGFIAALGEAGVQARACHGRDLYEWLLPFFNPKPSFAKNTAELLKLCQYPEEDTHRPFGWDLSEQLMLSMPFVDCEEGVIEFDDVHMRALTLQSLREAPESGYFTAELKRDDKLYARFDRLPPGAMLSVTVVIRAQDRVRNHIQKIAQASRANTPDARSTAAECEQVLQQMAEHERLYPTFVTLYLRGADRQDLRRKTAAVNAQLLSSGLKFIEPRHDLLAIDAFLRGLPMNFDPQFDDRKMKRSRLIFASHIAALLPLYGRARGTGHPGIRLWNRGGESFVFDPLNPRDRKKNAHLLMLGPTGAGKSATGTDLIRQMAAIYRPRFVIVEVGGSFNLLGDYFKQQGLTVNRVTLTVGSHVSLPPFALAHRLLEDEVVTSALASADSFVASDVMVNDPAEIAVDEEPEQEEDEDAVKRDILGEMVITARLMITGGEEAENAKMTRADRYLIGRAILDAARLSKASGRPHPLAQDVANALIAMRQDVDLGADRKARAEEMGQAMLVFCDAGLRGQLFNREGQDWPDVDVTIVNLATLAQEGYEDALAIAYIGLMNYTHALAERTQYDQRPNIFITDEGHIITTNALLCPYAVKITKMWRKLGTWFWLFTQDMKDFPEGASRILNMCEWWFLLTMGKDEIEQVARFKSLTPEQRAMMESATKCPPKYTEGVLFSTTMQALFRNVPPAMSIALAMTEKHEKAERRTIMQERGISELEAAGVVASRMVLRRG